MASSNSPRAISLTQLNIADVLGGWRKTKIVIPVTRIDTIIETELSQWNADAGMVPFKASQLTKVNGDYIYIEERPLAIRDMINGLT